ncbi:MAG: hypothetical protein ABSD70_16195 [Terracidiphilus sp.]
MSTSGITSSLLSQIADSPSAANQFVTDLNQLAQDLESGNLSAAQQDYVTLTQDALDGATSSASTTSASGITTSLLSNIASSSASSTAFVNELNQLGADLSNGDLASSESDLLSLDSTALNATSTSSAAPGSSPSTPANSADITALVNATTQAMEDGDNSAISADMAQLASVSTSSAGASYLESESQNYGSGAPSSSTSGSVTQLLQSLDTNSSFSSGSSLNVLA